MNRRRCYLLMSCLLVALSPQLGHAQVANEGLANQIVAARQKNAALMKQYAWNSRVEIIMNGAVKDIRIEQVMYGPDGNLQRTVLNNDPSSHPRGFLRRRIADAEKQNMENYFKKLGDLIDQYTLPTAGKIIDFVSKAAISTPDANGQIQLTGNNVVKPGDSLTMSIQATTRQPRRMTISTFSDQDLVNVTATFKTLPNGLNYAAFCEVTVPVNGLTLQVQNYDYTNQGQ
jgi:hypothetical protein